MPYVNPLMVELMVPRGPEVAQRIHGFFDAIGWNVHNHSASEFDTYVAPEVGEFPTPTIAYWQTTNPDKIAQFEPNDAPDPSEYAHGLRLPRLADLVEICLIVPSDDDVRRIFDEGGQVLEAHAHVPPRTHAGREEFRFADPFNYALRVTANPGYEVNTPTHPLVGRAIDHYAGTSYEVDEVLLNATGYERTGRLDPTAIYTQTVAGHNPAGTRYARSLGEITSGTVDVDGHSVPIFEIRG